jgi:hypothetical protein
MASRIKPLALDKMANKYKAGDLQQVVH